MTDLLGGKGDNTDLLGSGISDSFIGKGDVFTSLQLGKGGILDSAVIDGFLNPFTKVTGLTDIGSTDALYQTLGGGVNLSLGGKGANSIEVGNSTLGGF